jgi:hypothetical protein
MRCGVVAAPTGAAGRRAVLRVVRHLNSSVVIGVADGVQPAIR